MAKKITKTMAKHIAKKELLQQLTNAGTVFMLGHVSESFFENELSKSFLNKYNKESIPFFKFLSDQKKKETAINNFKHSHWRVLIKESFEMIRGYCNDNDLFSELKKQDWYEFVRLLRNSISHDFRFDFTRYKQEDFPISWKTISIEYSSNGDHIHSSLLSREVVIDIFETMRDFAETL